MTNKQNHSLADKAGKRGSNSTSSLTSDELGGSKIALRTEEEQQAAAREREERDRRDARRKSLANRRVSFAAEATLHTFHEVEFKQQPATSTDAQRRPAAAISSRDTAPQEDIQPNSEQLDDQNAPFQPKRRRSSVAAPQVRMPSTEDDNLTSTIYSSDSEPADAVEEIAADEEEEEEDSNSDSDDGTMMSMETVEVTGTTNASERSVDSDEESSTIDAVLRMASQRAGAQRGGNDMEEDSDDGEEVIPSFGWAKKGNQQSSSSIEREAVAVVAPQSRSIPGDEGTEMDMDMDADMDMDMDMTRAMGRIIQPSVALGVDEEQEMSMDVTRAFGGILSENRMSNNTADLRSDQPDEEPMDGATMEFTTAIGGIHRSQPEYSDELEEENEDMSMELTTILGGVLSKKRNEGLEAARQRTLNRISDIDLDETKMDMTVGLGRIISVPSPDNNTTVDDELTLGMDMTMAIGGIINNGTNTGRMLGKRILEEEVDKPHTPKEAVITAVSQASPQRYSSPQRRVASATETTPDILTLRGKGLRRSVGSQVSVVNEDVVPKPKIPSPTKPSTPRQGLASPGRQVQSSRNRTPRSSSPKKAHAAPPNRTPSPVKPVQSRNRTSFFRTNPTTGERTPTAVLTPQRKLSGIGADRNGLGSPQVAALFERRGSIGDSASIFVPGKRVVAFNDPQGMVAEIDRERQEEAAKENISTVIEKDMNGSQEDKDATLNLREMIERLSPKRKQFRSRKSLHVGSAKGLLGKRPSELDDEDNAEDNDGIKRLKGHQGSPVKNIRLQQPPSKAETTGRATRASRRSLEGSRANLASSFSSPLKGTQALTPQNNKNFKDHTNQTIHNVNFHELASNADAETANDVDEERVHLQDFLNMTSIRFMELTTTKRRHTIAPGTHLDGSGADGEDDLSLEPCVVAGACTVPMLELYQHSCRELKKYISEGRRIIKEIETDTFEENPPLFQEYMSATPEVKALMDNQFKNVKTHARLLSKAMWYEWRMKLQDGLKEGLINISEGMKSDDLVLQEQQTLLASILPDIRKRYEALVEENSNLEEAAQELADCDPAELQAARDGLISLDHDIAEKKKLIASLRQQFETSEADVKVLAAQKVQCLADIEEAEATREECRGWTSTEVNALKGMYTTLMHPSNQLLISILNSSCQCY